MERDVLEMNSLQNNFVAHPLAILCVTPEIWIYLDVSYKSADFEGELIHQVGRLVCYLILRHPNFFLLKNQCTSNYCVKNSFLE